eukprot:4297360-Prymnesium_polylepis.1
MYRPFVNAPATAGAGAKRSRAAHCSVCTFHATSDSPAPFKGGECECSTVCSAVPPALRVPSALCTCSSGCSRRSTRAKPHAPPCAASERMLEPPALADVVP